MGGVMDGIAQVLTYSLHLTNGHFLEGSWDNAYYTRQWNTPLDVEVIVMPPTGKTRAEPASSASRPRWRRWRAPTRGRPARCRRASRSTTTSRLGSRRSQPSHRSPSRRPMASTLKGASDAELTPSSSTASQVSVDCESNIRVLWVLRDLLGVHGPKYGCGLDVCKACTCHINGKAFHPCSVSISADQADRQDHHDRGARGDGRQAPPSDAAGLARLRRGPVRVLPARADHDGRRARRAGPGGGPPDHRGRSGRRSATSADAAPIPGSARRSRPRRRGCRRSAARRAGSARLKLGHSCVCVAQRKPVASGRGGSGLGGRVPGGSSSL